MRKGAAAVGSAAFFLAAPGVVGGLIPWLLTGWQVREPVPFMAPVRALGAVLLAAGLLAVIQAFVRFVVEGLGTPAPVAAPERLVVGGPYRYVRNPMYVAVLAVVVGAPRPSSGAFRMTRGSHGLRRALGPFCAPCSRWSPASASRCASRGRSHARPRPGTGRRAW